MKYDPTAEQVAIDDAAVATGIPAQNHNHSIFFEATALSDSGSANAASATALSVIRVPVG